MKLAVLLYGQPRFWELSYKSIIQETTFENSTTDYYFHFWDKIAYHSHDPEYELTDKDKKNIITAYKPKSYSFTDYSVLEQTCEVVFKIVQKEKEKICNFLNKNEKKISTGTNEILFEYTSKTKESESVEDIINNIQQRKIDKHKKYLQKSIFEITQPSHLTYYLGQFVSLQEGAKLIEEEYDYIFRIRTDVLFTTLDLYKNKKEYTHDKRLFYDALYNNKKGIFCKYGDLQIWEGAYNTDSRVWLEEVYKVEEDHRTKARTNYDSFTLLDNKIYAKPRPGSLCTKLHEYNYKTQYLHMKDWYMVGSGPEMLQCINQYLRTIINMIKKSRIFLQVDGIDVNWSAGELVCGEVLGLNSIPAEELGYMYQGEVADQLNVPRMIICNRMIKIANKYTKQNILGRPHVRVLADSDIPLKEQYKKVIKKLN